MSRCLLRGVVICAVVVVTAVAPLFAQAVPRVEYANPIAGFTITVPEDWEMGTGALGNTLIAIDGDASGGYPWAQPVLWFFRAKQAPQEAAQGLAAALRQMDGATPQVQPAEGGGWEVTTTSGGDRGNLAERWLCRGKPGAYYAIGGMTRPEFGEGALADMNEALESCRPIRQPALQRFTEPTENAYRLKMPEGWKWEGQVYRALNVPGYFVWKVKSPDGLTGAFSAPPANFNIATPYSPAGACAETYVLQGLQKQLGNVRLEAVHELPRVGQCFSGLLRAVGIGNNPRVDKVRADYIAGTGETAVRVRVTVATFMLDGSALLGGRGNWAMMCSGAWAPVDSFEDGYPLGRGVIASLVTSPEWRNKQFEAANDVARWNGWVRRVRQFLFNVLYLDAEDTLHIPG